MTGPNPLIESLSLPALLADRLAACDRKVQERSASWNSLAPNGRRAALPGEILLRHTPLLETDHAWVAFLCEYTESLLEHFPENLFCDLDGLASATRQGSAPLFHALLELNLLYGCKGPIRFRYVHDFLYGWDWVKWLRRTRGKAAETPPFSMSFLQHLLSRAGEIGRQLQDRDTGWQELAPGEFRNPFPYSREQTDEALLLREASRRGLVPVRTWGKPLFEAAGLDRNWHQEREALARELGLA